MRTLSLKSFRLRNFKAVRDSGPVKFTPLTVFIGNNGSGKSSLLEAMETFQDIVEDDLDSAMEEWHGFEHIWYQGVKHEARSPRVGDRESLTNPMEFELKGTLHRKNFVVEMKIGLSGGGNDLFIASENVSITGELKASRDAFGALSVDASIPFDYGQVNLQMDDSSPLPKLDDGVSYIGETPYLRNLISDWQFLSLIPQTMGIPIPQRRARRDVVLEKDGSNIAEYLLSIRTLDQSAFDGIIETLRYVMPFALDLQPALTSELERTVYLQLTEGEYKVPGWLLSTGTLRIVALLATLRHPTPPPVILIEEIENGLDPRSIHLLIDEIRTLVESGSSQVIITTHSPYLLDLLDISQIVLVERKQGEPTFTRPADQESLQEWSNKFGPGKLYTMDLLHNTAEQ